MRLLGSRDDVINLLKGKRISNIFRFRDHRFLKLRSKFVFKNLCFFNSKLNGLKLGFNIPLRKAIEHLSGACSLMCNSPDYF